MSLCCLLMYMCCCCCSKWFIQFSIFFHFCLLETIENIYTLHCSSWKTLFRDFLFHLFLIFFSGFVLHSYLIMLQTREKKLFCYCLQQLHSGQVSEHIVLRTKFRRNFVDAVLCICVCVCVCTHTIWVFSFCFIYVSKHKRISIYVRLSVLRKSFL